MKKRLSESFNEYKLALSESIPDLLVGVAVLLIFLIAGLILRSLIRKRLLNRVQDRLIVNFLGRIIFILFLVIGIVLFLDQIGLGKAAGGLLAGAGVSAIILGFAFKDIGENFLAGFFLAFSRPFRIGDIVEVDGFKGVVKALNFRNTHVRTFDGRDIFLPNALLIKNPLQNYTRDGLLRHDFMVGIDYKENLQDVVSAILITLEKNTYVEKGENLKPFVIIDKYSSSTVDIRIHYWINYSKYQRLAPSLTLGIMNEVMTALNKNGFNMPSQIIEVKNYPGDKPLKLKSD